MSKFKSILKVRPSLPDHRDLYYSASLSVLQVLPPKIDNCPSFPVYDQGKIGSCTGNAFAGAVQFERIKAKEKPDFIPSRLFIYYNERQLENNVASDAGSSMLSGIKTLHKKGVCPEDEWTYDDTPADPTTNLFPSGSKPVTRPSDKAYRDAIPHKITRYERLHQSLNQLKGCLASGQVFVIGFAVYDSWFQGKGGNPSTIIPMPSVSDRLNGGHAVVVTGYDDEKQLFKFRNSWGEDIGEKGYFYMPYAYMLGKDLVFDPFVIYCVKA
ncbi:papain cysteine protease family protein [Liberibacter crescens BT-1]|uniref:Papain cysteine protease family protein n=1 Tax=Liberibacter crescens (strain BT-1) TaxID=1215343 RepID=L0ES79_LIBCB|nr:C1 family peptidase [Liberibacter crescens]AGA64359.1 papain cysteine protease family protein [Liberibacter crescens BT-1]AMC12553.1 peptidase C1 [Liberibacter crescens]